MKAAIIGGGVIGGGWAARFLLNGWDVAVFDPDPEAERKISEVLSNARGSLPMLYERSLPEEGRLSFAAKVAEAVLAFQKDEKIRVDAIWGPETHSAAQGRLDVVLRR